MKKILTLIFIACALTFTFGAGEKDREERIVKLSLVEWDAVKKCVDTNGYCRIASQQTVIVITNGLPDVEHFLPFMSNAPETDLGRNKLRLPGRRGTAPRLEFVPYFGQGCMR